VTLGAVLLAVALGVVALLAAWGAWFGYRVVQQNRALTARFNELELRLAQPRASAPSNGLRSVRADRPLLVIMSSRLGLFAELMKVLASLDHFAAEESAPIVYFNRASFLYWSDSGWNGSVNGWEYYFEPLSPYRLEDVLGVAAEDLADMTRIQIERLVADEVVINDRLLQGKFDMFGDVRPEHRDHFAELCREHVRVRDEILTKVDAFAAENLQGRSVIGVHFRSTDKLLEVGSRLEDAGWSADTLSDLELDGYIDEALRRAGDEAAIFLATEDAVALDRARDRLGDRLIHTEATRTREPLPPFISSGGAALGEEALIDCLLLARCSHLVHGVSNLSWAARMFNPELPRTNVVTRLIAAP
jgi:Nodulation protein Z (NodZ)